MTRFPHLRAAIFGTPWAIMEDRLEAIVEVVERRCEGVRLSAEEISAVRGARRSNGVLELVAIEAAGGRGSTVQSGGVIAVINIMGIIAQHASQVDDISGPGGTSTERVGASFRSALADPNVKAIVFNIDSPGGSVSGVQALADEIYKGRGKKPIVAQVNSMAASAAYWIGRAADEMIMTPGSVAGSIGVFATHKDVSAAAAKEGLVVTFISAGKYKVEGHSFAPLADEARDYTQSQVDAYYYDFVRDVARFSGVSVADVRSGFGEGRVVKDREAVKAGMAEGIGTLDDTLRRLSAGRASSSTKAEAVRNASEQAAVLDAPADAKAITIVKEGDPETLCLQDGWPAVTLISPELLADGGSLMSLSEDGAIIGVQVGALSAHYRLRGVTVAGDWICDLVALSGDANPPSTSPAPGQPAPTDAGEQSPEAKDAFRRRRHATRSRTV